LKLKQDYSNESLYSFEGKQNADLIIELPHGTMKANFEEKSATYNTIGE